MKQAVAASVDALIVRKGRSTSWCLPPFWRLSKLTLLTPRSGQCPQEAETMVQPDGCPLGSDAPCQVASHHLPIWVRHVAVRPAFHSLTPPDNSVTLHKAATLLGLKQCKPGTEQGGARRINQAGRTFIQLTFL